MVFEKLYTAKEWFLNYTEFEKPVINFWTEYDSKDWKFGDFILFQHIKDEKVISRPILGIFTSFTIWDQALVMNFIQNKRAWTFSHELITNPEGGYKMLIGFLDDEIETIQFWTDNINVLGHWKNKPNLSELKSALKNTITSRDSKIENILN
jgi:hypothetical protein